MNDVIANVVQRKRSNNKYYSSKKKIPLKKISSISLEDFFFLLFNMIFGIISLVSMFMKHTCKLESRVCGT